MAKKKIINGMTINAYLTNFSRNRKIDKVFVKWFQRIDPMNPSKTKEAWDKLIK